MSRGQQGAIVQTAGAENKTLNTNSNTSFNTAQQDLDTLGNQVGAFQANNPYVQGGQAQVAEDQQIADAGAAGGQALTQAVSGAAVRTGQNPGGAIAAGEEIARENNRALPGQEAAATQARLAAGTGYTEAGLAGREKVAGMEDTIANQQGQLAEGALNTDEKASQTPSFMDELGQGLITAGDNFAGGFGQGYGKAVGCWIAAAVFDEDFNTGLKTNLVRNWLWTEWSQHWYARPILALYSRFGERAAKWKPLVRLLRPLFESALKEAVKRG